MTDQVWTEGRFYDQTEGYTAKIWLGSLHIIVDLTKDKITYLKEGLGKPAYKIPLTDGLVTTERVARDYKDVKSLDVKDVYLLAVYDRMSNSIVIFRYVSQTEEVLVGVDLTKMTIIEKLSGKVGGV